MTTGLKHPRENDRVLMAKLRAKYGLNYNGPVEHPRPTRRQLLASFSAMAEDDRRLVQRDNGRDPDGWYRLFGGAGHNKRKDMHVMGGTCATVKRGVAVTGTGVPRGE